MHSVVASEWPADHGERWARALAAIHPDAAGRPKRVAADFGVEIKTAEAWCAGRMAQARYVGRGWRLYGWVFAAAVLAPETLADFAKAQT